jgi:hypothetical protein
MNIKNEDAVSPVLGTILLLIISIALFSVLFSVVSGLEPTNKGHSSYILAYSDNNQIIIDHFGGESIDIRSNLILYNDDNELNIIVGDYMTEESKKDGLWNIGESVTYNSFILLSKDVYSNDIRFSIVDYLDNCIIVSGNLKI